MKVIVNEDRTLEIINQATTQNENDIELMQFTFPEKYENWNKKIVFILPIKTNNIVWDLIQNNEYTLQLAITQYNQVQFYVWLTHNEQDFRSETKTLHFNDNKDASGQVTPEQLAPIQEILAEVDTALQEVDNIDINVSKSNNITTVTITKKDGTEKSVNILDGYTPQKGIDYWTQEDKSEILTEIDNNIQTYINQPFITMEIVNGDLIAEVKEWKE